ncbi:hypothetical protein DL96DRAFT_1575376 [Flagelloscypha sp. PMI_526]|nr:hypothetical protein DL96DRAFT_1575376 [Flagelloscypha sp. PMI_526]
MSVRAPLAFGMANPAWQPTHAPALQQVSNIPSPGPSSSPSKLKRRFEEDESREPSLDPSPPPDRPRKAAPLKRAKLVKDVVVKPEEHNDVDIGVLLASLPSDSLLPILTSLIKEQPTLKSAILPLIPRPALQTVVDMLTTAARQLKEAYPYSNVGSPFQSPSQPFAASSTFGFGSGSFGFGSAAPSRPASAFGSLTPTSSNGSGMRDQYIQSRLRPHIDKFVGLCLTYLPYFSHVILQSQSPPSQTICETYTLLSHITAQILSQPPLTQATLVPMLHHRLTEEWHSWLHRVDNHVNKQAGLFGTDVVNTWSRGLDELCQSKTSQQQQQLHDLLNNIRKRWISSVGWMIGRFPSPEPMDV